MPGRGSDGTKGATSGETLRARIVTRLEQVRERTQALLDPLTEEAMTHQPGPEMGVVAWDVGHIGAFEEVWLVQNVSQGGRDLSALGERFDPLEHPRSERGEMELPSKGELLAYLHQVRKKALDVLSGLGFSDEDPLLRDGFVYDMIARHETQHQENMLITLQMFEPEGPVGAYRPPIREDKPPAVKRPLGMIHVPGGRFPLGTDRRIGHYDNEWPQHEVEVEPFEIDATPVTNGEFLAFVEDGGYDQEEHWSTDGWLIREALGWEQPRTWHHGDRGWQVREYDRVCALPLDQPVAHVSYHEAEAYAAWAGKRLPTEAEWEYAATFDPETGTKTRYPWGDEAWSPERANLRQELFGPAPVGAYPRGVSPVGCHQMVGDLWEWTSSTFTGYPGFEAFPYPEYSQAFFDAGFRVLRGGSWATWPACATGTFRNWHQGDHRQLFAGFRCVRDAGTAP